MPSPFFSTAPTATAGALAILHLKRDQLLPVTLRASADDGYAEGAVTNTRFGSFPHSTLLDVPWGSQVRASNVDTGSRGRKGKAGRDREQIAAVTADRDAAVPMDRDAAVKMDGDAAVPAAAAAITADERRREKRKSEEVLVEASPPKKQKQSETAQADDDLHRDAAVRQAVQAGSGFIHLLPPTPEAWTLSLDHRTQVVYTPDYSYILQRLRVRPGQSIVEAGAGSGSFTHAAARAVFNGYRSTTTHATTQKRKQGQVHSFEYHLPRVSTLRDELHAHGLAPTVHLTHRDVCTSGFLPTCSADAVFLDLPAPHLALRHLTRAAPSPLNPLTPTHLCTFSPCIEQVTATVSALRRLGWTSIEMAEVRATRLDVRRERVGLREEGLRGVNASAASVPEALARLREVENKLSSFHRGVLERRRARQDGLPPPPGATDVGSKLARLKRNADGLRQRRLYREGDLACRSEPELRTHTSYLVFAVLPRAWGVEDEAAAAAEWALPGRTKGGVPAAAAGGGGEETAAKGPRARSPLPVAETGSS